MPSPDTLTPAQRSDAATMRGIDVSHYQGHVDWQAVASAGYSFAFYKLTEGSTFTDPTAARNETAGRAAGLRMGPYHFFRGAGLAEAAHFLRALPPDVAALPARLPPALDLEAPMPDDGGTEALAWLRAVEDALHARPFVYVGRAWARLHGLRRWPELADYPLWLACWETQPIVPEPWASWAVWQTGSARVPGVNGKCDVDVARER